MLVSNKLILRPDPILDIIGKGRKTVELQTGVYEISHFGCSNWLPGYDDYPEFADEDFNCYGVCDNVGQLLNACPELETVGREFTIVLTKITKAEQDPRGGWRWHKWGPYVGTQNPQHEYIYNEPDIEYVYVYHIYERVA